MTDIRIEIQREEIVSTEPYCFEDPEMLKNYIKGRLREGGIDLSKPITKYFSDKHHSMIYAQEREG